MGGWGSEPAFFYSKGRWPSFSFNSTVSVWGKWTHKHVRLFPSVCTSCVCVCVCERERRRRTQSRSTRQEQQIHYICLTNNFLWKIDVFWPEQLFTLTTVTPLAWCPCMAEELSFSARTYVCVSACACVWSGLTGSAWLIQRAQTQTRSHLTLLRRAADTGGLFSWS